MARLDRLGGSAKEVAQIGAAIGREFSTHALLAAVAGKPGARNLKSALDRLVGASGLLFRQGVAAARDLLCSSTRSVQDAGLRHAGCVSPDARCMPVSPKRSKATSPTPPRTSPRFWRVTVLRLA